MTRRNNKRPVVQGLLVAIMGFVSSMAFAGTAMAKCESGSADVATAMVQETRKQLDDIERLVLLKSFLKDCPEFVAWVELGKVQLELENTPDAVFAFTHARDFYEPADDGSFTPSELKRQAIGNAWLAEAHLANGELARASVAVQEARRSLESVNLALPQRLIALQANIDDSMASADASVLTRSFELQHERATRGIGVRPVVRDAEESPSVVANTDMITEDYAGTTVAELEPVADPVVDTDAELVAPTESETAETESRLNIPVLFEFDSADLSAASQNTVAQLGTAINALNLSPTDTVAVIGHTDSQGAAQYNQALSVKRANTVLAAIRTLVAADPNFVATGLGEEELRYAGNTPDDHRRNRRVEIVVRR